MPQILVHDNRKSLFNDQEAEAIIRAVELIRDGLGHLSATVRAGAPNEAGVRAAAHWFGLITSDGRRRKPREVWSNRMYTARRRKERLTW